MSKVVSEQFEKYRGEYGPLEVNEQGQPTYGEIIRYTRRLHQLSSDDIGVLYGKILQGKPVTGRHILRMEQTDTFFPKDPKRRWVLAKLLSVSPALMGLVGLEEFEPTESKSKHLVSSPAKAIDVREYYTTLKSYWIDGYPISIEDVIKDVKGRIHRLHTVGWYASPPQKVQVIRLLWGYQILLGTIAQEQQCYQAARAYLTNAITLAKENAFYDLQAIALVRREEIFYKSRLFDNAVSDFDAAYKLKIKVSSQVYGYMLTIASKSKAHVAQNQQDIYSVTRYLDSAERLALPASDFKSSDSSEDFQFFIQFDQNRYLLDRAGTLVASGDKNLRSPAKAQEYLDLAIKQNMLKGGAVSGYRKISTDLNQAKIYIDQGHYPMAATHVESALVTMNSIQSQVHLHDVKNILQGLKKQYPHGTEVYSLELELMKVRDPYVLE